MDNEMMNKLVEAEQMIIELKGKLHRYRVENQTLALENEELQLQLDGWVKCSTCNGEGGKHTQRGSHGPDPQSWVDCPVCKGEGWIQN